MKIEQRINEIGGGWKIRGNENLEREKSQLVFVFGDSQMLLIDSKYAEIKQIYPNANIVYVSDSGSIVGTDIVYDTFISTAIQFEKSSVSIVSEVVEGNQNSYEIGKKLGEQVQGQNLHHLMILAEGLGINGSELIRGIKEKIPKGITLSGGLAGDDLRFEKTYVSLNDNKEGNQIVLIGFHGDKLKIGFGSFGGWDNFGLKRTITKSSGNILYEIDGKPALDLYKEYLGDMAKQLPKSGFYFPLSIRSSDSDIIIVRTLLGINEANKSVIFGGDVPEGYEACLMKANLERVIDGAGQAAKNGMSSVDKPELAILISCVGRKEVLKQRAEEELENARYVLGKSPIMTGFYSYGEIAPSGDLGNCYLHNQTMTITLFQEI